MNDMGARARGRSSARPQAKLGFSLFPVANELVVLSPDGEVALALNESAAAVWQLCDGAHTALDMLDALRTRYDGRNVRILADITETLFRFAQLGMIDLALPRLDPTAAEAAIFADDAVTGVALRPHVRFVFGIEDKPYFHWQLGILLESLVGQLALGWDITLVVCNDHAALSPALTRLVSIYGVGVLTGQNHAHSLKIDFSSHEGGYVALNRVEALKAMAPRVAADELVCLMDSDVFLYGDLNRDVFPLGNALAADEIMRDPRFLSRGDDDSGIDLQQLLGALGCRTELKRGAVTVFMTGATLKNDKVIKDCFRFAQIIYLLGKTGGLPDSRVWMAEMACFAMALTANRVDYELLQAPQFKTPVPQQESIAAGSFFHYYADVNDGCGGPFLGSAWNKQLFGDRDFLAENLASFRAAAKTDLERRFFDLGLAARRRLQKEHV